jgi:transketolase
MALMRSLPNLTVIQPADGRETEQAVAWMLEHEGPVYLRLTRQKVADVTPPDHRFEVGRGVVLRDGGDLVIVATGAVVGPALDAAEMLARERIDAAVINIHTIKPIDEELLRHWAGRVERFLTVEDHGIDGGLGSAVCETVAGSVPVIVHRHGVRTFGESGSAEALYRKHGLDAPGIATRARALVAAGVPSRPGAARHVAARQA